MTPPPSGSTTLYLDSSSLVKLYVDERDSEDVRTTVADVATAATSLIAYAEVCSALARRRREGGLAMHDHAYALGQFDLGWPSMMIVDVTVDVVRRAARLTERHALRAYDAIHLASALTLEQSSKSPLVFMTADRRLAQAAEAEGLRAP